MFDAHRVDQHVVGMYIAVNAAGSSPKADDAALP
jgi:hypothetical protein